MGGLNFEIIKREGTVNWLDLFLVQLYVFLKLLHLPNSELVNAQVYYRPSLLDGIEPKLKIHKRKNQKGKKKKYSNRFHSLNF